MKLFLVFFLVLFFCVNSFAFCTESPCSIVRDDETVAPSVDLNFIQSTEHSTSGLTFDFDVNFSLRRPNGTYEVQNASASQSEDTGIWFYQLIGGLSTKGDYIAIWTAEHTNGGVADGNKDSEIWKIRIQEPDLNSFDFNAYIDSKLNSQFNDLNNNLNLVDSNISSTINNSLSANVFDDDLNAYIDTSHTQVAYSVSSGTKLYLRGSNNSGVALPTHTQLDTRVFLVGDSNAIFHEVSVSNPATVSGGLIYMTITIGKIDEQGETISDGNYTLRMEAWDSKTSINNDVIRGETLQDINLSIVESEKTGVVVGKGTISNEEWKVLTGVDLEQTQSSSSVGLLEELQSFLASEMSVTGDQSVPNGFLIGFLFLVGGFVVTNRFLISTGHLLYVLAIGLVLFTLTGGFL